jgi:hypothetical protein
VHKAPQVQPGLSGPKEVLVRKESKDWWVLKVTSDHKVQQDRPVLMALSAPWDLRVTLAHKAPRAALAHKDRPAPQVLKALSVPWDHKVTLAHKAMLDRRDPWGTRAPLAVMEQLVQLDPKVMLVPKVLRAMSDPRAPKVKSDHKVLSESLVRLAVMELQGQLDLKVMSVPRVLRVTLDPKDHKVMLAPKGQPVTWAHQVMTAQLAPRAILVHKDQSATSGQWVQWVT